MDKLTPSLEDYLESIWIIGLTKKVVRVKNIAEFLSLRTASVIGAIKILSEKGLVIHESYGYIELTNKGIIEAKKIYEKHKTLSKFFNEMLGVDLRTATKDACQFEHYISKRTMNRIIKFIKFIETCPEGEPNWLSSFQYFAKYGKRPKCDKKQLRVKS